MATIGSYYVEKAAAAARSKGIDVDALIQIAGIEAERTFKSNLRLSDNTMTLYLNLLANATNDAFLGFAHNPIPINYFQVFIQNLYYCQNLKQSIDSMCATLALANCQLTSQISEEQLTLSLEHEHVDPDHFILEYLLVLIHRLLSWLSGKQVNALKGAITYTPKKYRQEFSLLFRCPMTFDDSANTLTFDISMLDFNVVRRRADFQKLIKQFPLIVMRYPGEENLFDRQVHQYLLEHFNQKFELLDANAVANHFGMSNATLRRRLAKLMTSYAQIKLELRKALATRLLLQGALSIEDIAFKLSYSDARSFSRAFKQWTNLTPSAYQRYTQARQSRLHN